MSRPSHDGYATDGWRHLPGRMTTDGGTDFGRSMGIPLTAIRMVVALHNVGCLFRTALNYGKAVHCHYGGEHWLSRQTA